MFLVDSCERRLQNGIANKYYKKIDLQIANACANNNGFCSDGATAFFLSIYIVIVSAMAPSSSKANNNGHAQSPPGKIVLKKNMANPYFAHGVFDPSAKKPFKNPSFDSFIGSKRKWKNVKALLSAMSSEKADSSQDGAHSSAVPKISYPDMDAAPSLLPRRKYCDITGLESLYIDPKSGLRYSSADVYSYIRGLSSSHIQEYLSIRNAHITLK